MGNKGIANKLAYTIKEAACVASVEEPTIIRAIQDGMLRARRVEDCMVVLRTDIRTWLGSQPTYPLPHDRTNA